jgi:hypothetical protein
MTTLETMILTYQHINEREKVAKRENYCYYYCQLFSGQHIDRVDLRVGEESFIRAMSFRYSKLGSDGSAASLIAGSDGRHQ